MIIKGRRDILERKGAWILAEAIQHIAMKRSRVVLAVPGGRSVVSLLKYLSQESVDWEKVHLFMVDERMVPPDHEESNFRLVSECFREITDAIHFHSFPYIPGNSVTAAANYKTELQHYGGQFDITLLASGEDGHIAGLFPEHETVRDDGDFFVLTETAPKPPPERVSSTKKLIGKSVTALLLFFGEEKHVAFSAYLDGSKTIHQCPAKIVDSIACHYVLTDCPD